MENQSEDKDLLDEILTMDAMHEIDDSENKHGPRPLLSSEKLDDSLFEQLLWQPSEEIDDEIGEAVMDTTDDLGITDSTKDEVTVDEVQTLTVDSRGCEPPTDGVVEPSVDVGGEGGLAEPVPEVAANADPSTPTSEKDRQAADESSGDDASRKRRQISPIMWNKLKDEAAAEDDPESKKQKTDEIPVSPEAERISRLKYVFRSARFFIIKSNNYENVALAKARGIWSTPPQNEARLNQAFKQCANVILVFSIQESGKFQGYARLASESDKNHAPVRWVLPPGLEAKVFSSVFKLDWVTRRDLPFVDTMHLKNSWNMNKPVKVGRDGQEVEPTIGEALCRLFPADDNIDIYHIVHLAKQALRKLERAPSAAAAAAGSSAPALAHTSMSKSPTLSSPSREKRSEKSRESEDLKRHKPSDRRDGRRDRDYGEGIPVRYGVRTETLLNGTYSDYVREFNKIPTVPHSMPSYAPAMAPAYSYIHPQYLYGQQLQQPYVMPQMTASGYAPPYADRPISTSSSDHHHHHPPPPHYNYSDHYGNDYSRDYYREHDYRRDRYDDHR